MCTVVLLRNRRTVEPSFFAYFFLSADCVRRENDLSTFFYSVCPVLFPIVYSTFLFIRETRGASEAFVSAPPRRPLSTEKPCVSGRVNIRVTVRFVTVFVRTDLNGHVGRLNLTALFGRSISKDYYFYVTPTIVTLTIISFLTSLFGFYER